MLGGALFSLALRFPEEWHAIGRRPWILGVPYGISILLAVSGLWALNNASNPWAYIQAWGAAYRYTALGIIVFLATMFYQAWASKSLLTRRQARIVLLGSALAFLPIVIWFLSPLFGVALQFNPALFLPTLVIFPLSVAVAIFRYRLLEVDTLVNRTVFYGIMTAILAGVASGTITLCQKIFVTVTGEKSDMALVIATLILVAAFEPVKSRMRSLVDSRLKEAPDNTRDLRAFGHEVHSFLEISDPRLVTQHLLEEVVSGLRAQSGAVSLHVDGRLEPIYTVGRWQGDAWLSVPLESEGERYGLLVLGPRTTGESYTRQEGEIVAQVASEVARAVRRAAAARAVAGPQWIGEGRAYAELERARRHLKPARITDNRKSRAVSEGRMNGQSNVITAERALKAVWNGARRIDREALFAPSFRFRNLGESDDVTDLWGLRKRITHVRAAHPDGHLERGRRVRIRRSLRRAVGVSD